MSKKDIFNKNGKYYEIVVLYEYLLNNNIFCKLNYIVTCITVQNIISLDIFNENFCNVLIDDINVFRFLHKKRCYPNLYDYFFQITFLDTHNDNVKIDNIHILLEI